MIIDRRWIVTIQGYQILLIMKYFTTVKSPFSVELENKLKRLVDDSYINHDYYLQSLPIEHIKKEINSELSCYKLKIAGILTFYYKPTIPNTIHVDYFDDDEIICNCSLVIPWKLEEDYTVYWKNGEYKLSEEYYKNIKYNKIDWLTDEILYYETKISTSVVVKTNIPHGVLGNKSEYLLATFRFEGNPDFEEVCEKFAVE